MSTLDDLILWFTELFISLNMNDIQIFNKEISGLLIFAIISGIVFGIFRKRKTGKSYNNPDAVRAEADPKQETHTWSISLVVSIILIVIVTTCIVINRRNMSDIDEQPFVPENTVIEGSSTSDNTLLLTNINNICDHLENSFSALCFEKGSLTTEMDTFDTSTMSAEIHDLYIGNTAYLWQELNSGKYIALFIPIHFSMNIKQTLTFDKQTIDDVVGYSWITLSEVDKQGNLCYEVYNYLTAQYFMTEELLYEHLCGNGYIVEKIELKR